MSAVNSPKLRRLNGRLQACDPCRRRKVACDHGQPVCQRCRKRKAGAQCTYTISARSAPSFGVTSPSSASRSPPATATEVVPSKTDSRSSVAHTPSSASGATPSTNSKAPGYLGYISYTGAIDEARESLTVPAEGVQHELKPYTDFPISNSILDRGVEILRQIPTIENFPQVCLGELIYYHRWIHLMVEKILEKLYDPDAFGYHIARGDDASLREMARRICINTAQPAHDTLAGDDWLDQFRGRNLRWECVSLLLGVWYTHRVLDKGAFTPAEEMETWWNTRRHLKGCTDLSDEFSRGNLVTIYAYHHRTSLETLSSGDASLRSWKNHAETVACFTFLGFHAEPTNDGPYVPTLVSELKRLMCASLYSADKTLASFTGRPPLLTKAFITTPLPLDLNPLYLFESQKVLAEKAATMVDEHGWSTDSSFTAATSQRVRYMMKSLREDILVVALGNHRDVTKDALLELHRRQIDIIDKFPNSVRYNSADLNNHAVSGRALAIRLVLRMESIQNEFFINRLLLKRGHLEFRDDLLLSSFQLVSDTVTIWTNYDRFSTIKRDFEWLLWKLEVHRSLRHQQLMAYGAPAGGILCKELQQPTLISRRHPQDPSITRSSIIQKLSLLVAFLDWVSPDAPNANLCHDCKTVIQLVLDQALNNPVGAGSGGAGAGDGTSDQVGGNLMPSLEAQLEYDFPAGLEFNFDLMDSFDWLGASEL